MLARLLLSKFRIISLLVAFSTNLFGINAVGDGYEGPFLRNIGGNSFIVSFNIYSNCSKIPPPTYLAITIKSSCGSDTSFYLASNPNIVPDKELFIYCSSLKSTCHGGTVEDFYKRTYQDTIHLTQGCVYKLGVKIDCVPYSLSDSIHNQPSYLETYFDYYFSNQSTPFFEIDPVFTGTINTDNIINFSANDINGDSLSYKLSTSYMGPDTAMLFATGYNASAPFGISQPPNLNEHTGTIHTNPLQYGAFRIGVEVEKSVGCRKLCSVKREHGYLFTTFSPRSNNISFVMDSFKGTDTTNFASRSTLSYSIDTPIKIQFEVIDPVIVDTLSWETNISSEIPSANYSVTLDTISHLHTVTIYWIPRLAKNKNVFFTFANNHCYERERKSIFLKFRSKSVIPLGNQTTVLICKNDTAELRIDTTNKNGLLWSTGATSNTIRVTPTTNTLYNAKYFSDSLCTAVMDEYNVIVIAAPNISFNAIDSAYCFNTDTIHVTVSPPGGRIFFNGLLSNGVIQPKDWGGQTIHITYELIDANNCKYSDSIQTKVFENTVVSIQRLDSVYCYDSKAIHFFGQPSGGNFLLDGHLLPDSNWQPSLSDIGVHKLMYRFLNSEGCFFTDSADFSLKICDFILSTSHPNFALFPNPVKDWATLFLNTPLTEEATITLTDVQGRTVLRENINANMAYKHINFSALPSGVYVLTINDTYAKLKVVKGEY